MRSWRKILLAILSFLLLAGLLLGLPLAALVRTLSDKNTVIAVINTEPIYQKLRQAADDLPLDQAGRQRGGVNASSFFDAQSFTPLVEEYLDYGFYQQASTTIVDSVYDWLEGESAAPEFSIPITTEPTKFRETFVNTLVNRYQDFPPCREYIAADLDQLFEARCRLPGLSGADIRPVINREIMESDLNNFINKATIDSTEFTSTLDPQDTARVQRVFSWAKALPPIVGLFTAGLALIIGLLIFNRRQTFRGVGLRLMIPGAILLLVGLVMRVVSTPLLNLMINTAQSTESTEFIEVIKTAAQKLMLAVSNRWLLYSLLVALFGLLGILGQKLINKEPLRLNFKRAKSA